MCDLNERNNVLHVEHARNLGIKPLHLCLFRFMVIQAVILRGGYLSGELDHYE